MRIAFLTIGIIGRETTLDFLIHVRDGLGHAVGQASAREDMTCEPLLAKRFFARSRSYAHLH